MIQPNLKPEVREFIHQICARAIMRAMENGTFENDENNDIENGEEAP